VRERIDGFSEEKEAAFLAELERSGCIRDAARVADISTTSISRHRRFRPAFDSACKLARVKARGPLEAIAWQRAVEGAETKIFRNGKLVEVRLKPSDAMLKTMLQASNPAKFGRPGGAVAALPGAAASGGAAVWPGQEVPEPTLEERMEVVERVMRKLHKLARRMISEGCGLTVDGQMVPKGYGPIAPDARPMMADPLSYTPRQEAEDVVGVTSDEERLQRAQRLG
jgi:hypothetical protein